MNISKKIAAIAVTAVLTVGGLSVAQSATAAEIPGTITLIPAAGNVSDTNLFSSIAVSVGAVAPNNQASGTFAYQNGVLMGSLANARLPGTNLTNGNTGLDGQPALMDRSLVPTNNFVSNKQLSALTTPLVTGAWELRFYYFASSSNPNSVTDPYVKLDMTFDSGTGAWAVAVAPAAATTTTLTAQATAQTVALTATVAPAGAVGTVTFSEGSTVVAGPVTVASGVARATLLNVAVGQRVYTATFTPTVVANFTASTSANVTVTVAAAVVAPVAPVPAPRQLASTGTDLGVASGMGAAALALMALGGALLVARRRVAAQ
jgi:hypothetical protein